MISVPSLLRQLSGNRSTYLLLCISFLLLACSGQKNLKGSKDSDKDVPLVYNPKTGEYEPVKDPEATIDTVHWTIDPDAAPPIGAEPLDPKGKKEVYSLSLMIPFKADQGFTNNEFDARTRRFLHYYAGAKMALEELERAGILLDVNVYDTRESIEKVSDLLDESRNADVIVGPYRRTAIKEAAAFAKNRKVPVVSPWLPALTPESPSDYFLQAVPGLETHASTAMQYAKDNYPGAKYFLVASPSTEDQSRMDVYSDAFERVHSPIEPINKLVVDEDALRPDSNYMSYIYDQNATNVFFMPFYLRSEEEFINSFMRKIHAEHGENEVVIFGLPQWLNFNNINANYLESLNTHITVAQFEDKSSEEVKRFHQTYYDEYATIPEPAAWQAYTLITYLGHSLEKYGTGFIENISADRDRYFRFLPEFSKSAEVERDNPILYYENKAIEVLEFTQQRFRIAE